MLSHRVADDPVVPAENFSVTVNEIAGERRFSGVKLNYLCIVSVGDETDILAVGLVGVEKSVRSRDPAHIGFS